ncbi:hypothetical protein FOMPIDRAFT_1015004 [Fomitopsis schrenkii]|uniref:Uncharacterized protein n=1 Tax=Fomitopsis schrenkii TaxID=2126942 RepID=S8FP53_FOMSC|nr:hypothetical protein FOMPIDRAFT_1015004 [Fomitopsis schrenkii]
MDSTTCTMQASPTSSDVTLHSDMSGTEGETLVGEDAPPSPPSSPDPDSESDEYCDTYELYVVQYHQEHGVEWNVAISTAARHVACDLSGRTTNIGHLYRLETDESGIRVHKQQDMEYESLEGWSGSILVTRFHPRKLREAESIIREAVLADEGTRLTCTWGIKVIQELRMGGFEIQKGCETADDL